MHALIKQRVEQRNFAAWERLSTRTGEESPSEAYTRLRLSMIAAERQRVLEIRREGQVPSHVVREVPVVACASFANATATARLMAGQECVLLVPTEGDEDDALADFLTARAEGRHVEMGRLLERVAESAAGVECLERGLDPAFPGFHPRDLELAQRVDVFNHALIAQPVGDLLELKVR